MHFDRVAVVVAGKSMIASRVYEIVELVTIYGIMRVVCDLHVNYVSNEIETHIALFIISD